MLYPLDQRKKLKNKKTPDVETFSSHLIITWFNTVIHKKKLRIFLLNPALLLPHKNRSGQNHQGKSCRTDS